jgi:hypothetical protein
LKIDEELNTNQDIKKDLFNGMNKTFEDELNNFSENNIEILNTLPNGDSKIEDITKEKVKMKYLDKLNNNDLWKSNIFE